MSKERQRMSDFRQRFLFENLPIRGMMVRLSSIYQKAAKAQNYTAFEKQLLGEALLAVIMLAGIGKQAGKMLLQFQGKGALEMLSAQATHTGHIRAMLRRQSARNQEEASCNQALFQGQLGVIYQPASGAHYQSLVEVVEGGLIPSLEHYFTQSEQILTKVYIFEKDEQLFALLLQALPDKGAEQQAHAFEHACTLANTLTQDESFALENVELLYRLFNQESVRLFEEEVLTFGCENPKSRFENAVLSLGLEEAEKVLEEQNHIAVTCEFCAKEFKFDQIDVEALFKNVEQSFSAKSKKRH